MKLKVRSVLANNLLLFLLLLAVGQVIALGVANAAQAVIVDRGKIYFGNSRKFEKPATIKRMKVFDEIPAYQRIKEKKLKPSDADYYFLIEEASKVFRATVAKVANVKSYDLVAEENALETSGITLPDMTTAAIDQIHAEE